MFKVEVIAIQNGCGIFSHDGTYYLVCVDNGWKPQVLTKGENDVFKFTFHWHDFQAVKDVSFSTQDEAISYIRQAFISARGELPEFHLEDIIGSAPLEILYRVIDHPQNYPAENVELAKKELIKRQQL